MKKAWKLVVSLLLAAAMMAPLPFAALATTPYQDPNAGKVYIVGSGEELDENKTEEHAPGYYDKGTYTNRNFDEAGNYYIKKQFDWTDAPTKSEGVITFKTRLKPTEPLTAVYAFTPCEGHGFTKVIAKRNIEYLLAHYDRVDLIWLNGTSQVIGTRILWQTDLNGIKITEDVGKDNDGNGTDDYIDILDDKLSAYWGTTNPSIGRNGAHWGRSIYSGLYAYLAGMEDGSDLIGIQNGDSTVTLSSFQREGVNLAAIYISFDGILDSRWFGPSGAPYNLISNSGEGKLEYPTTKYDCWNLLYQYRQAGRYYSLGMDGSGTLNEFSFITSLTHANTQNTPEARAIRAESINNPDNVYYPMWNELLALADPSLLRNMPVISAEGFPDGQLWNGVKRNTDEVEEVDVDAHTNPPNAYTLLRACYRIKDPNKRFGFDYGYNQDFATLGVPVVGMTLEDTISDIFTIDTIDTTDGERPWVTMEAAPADGAVLNYMISGNKVTFSINNYKPETELTFKIHVKVNDDNVTNYLDRWFDTNTSAKLAVSVGEDNPDNYDITSPKAHLERRNVTVTKIWDDNNNQDGIRPDSVKVTLYQQIGSGAKTVVTRTDNPKTLNAGNNWTYTWTELPEYQEGQWVTYTVAETELDNRYTTTYDPASASVTEASGTITITNKHTPETMDVTATKTWNDNDNQDGIRPDSVEVTLYQQIGSGTKMKVTRADNPKTLNADNRWAYTWTGLAEKSSGTNIVYSVEESAVSGYEAPTYTPATVSGADGTITITNKHTPETMDVTATKTWEDNDNQDGIRPDSVEVTLYQQIGSGTKMKVTRADNPKTLNADNRWAYTWTGLAEKSSGTNIVYSVEESPVSGYEAPTYDPATVSGADGTIKVTNKHTPETMDVTATKTWEDSDNQDGIRPENITLTLSGKYTVEGTEKSVTIADAEVTITPDNGVWPSHTWTNLPKKQEGQLVTYTVAETAIDGYTTAYEPASLSGATGTIAITNTHASDTLDVTATKTWEDNDNQDSIRPENITLTLSGKYTVDGTEKSVTIADAEVTITPDNGVWPSHTWTDLPKNQEGQLVTYTVTETAIDGYTTAYDPASLSGATGTIAITNTHASDTLDVTATKTWEDNDDQDGIRPASITLTLSGKYTVNGTEKSVTIADAEVTITPDNGVWPSHTWANLPKNQEGQLVTYTVTETAIDGYTTAYEPASVSEKDGTITITNSYTPKPTPKPEPDPTIPATPNPYVYKFTFTKKWQGDAENSIDWTFYAPDGSEYRTTFKKEIVSEYEWHYENWFTSDADYYLVEKVPAGYKVRYENVGKHAGETDRCYNGGTIINYKVPKTGDTASPALWIGLAVLGLGGLSAMALRSKKKIRQN